MQTEIHISACHFLQQANSKKPCKTNCIPKPDVRKTTPGGSRRPFTRDAGGSWAGICAHNIKIMSDFGRRQGDLSSRSQGGIFGRRQADVQFDQSAALLGVLSLDFKLKVINPAWEKSLGYGRSEMLGRSLSAFVASDEQIPVHRL